MLLNISNHPSAAWSTEQMTAALASYGRVEDIPFPNVPPEATRDEVRQMVEAMVTKIRVADPSVLHIMGEMTFTYALVRAMEHIGIPCVASTTHRTVEEKDGKKIVTFAFVQFRGY